MLSNADLLAKFRFDTAENEPAKHFAKFCARKKTTLQALLLAGALSVLVPAGARVLDAHPEATNGELGPALASVRHFRRSAASSARVMSDKFELPSFFACLCVYMSDGRQEITPLSFCYLT